MSSSAGLKTSMLRSCICLAPSLSLLLYQEAVLTSHESLLKSVPSWVWLDLIKILEQLSNFLTRVG